MLHSNEWSYDYRNKLIKRDVKFLGHPIPSFYFLRAWKKLTYRSLKEVLKKSPNGTFRNSGMNISAVAVHLQGELISIFCSEISRTILGREHKLSVRSTKVNIVNLFLTLHVLCRYILYIEVGTQIFPIDYFKWIDPWPEFSFVRET